MGKEEKAGKYFENIVGKGENTGNQPFLLFPQCFLPFPKQISIFQSLFFHPLRILSIWTGLKFCRLVELNEAEIMICVFDIAENFSPFPIMFSKVFFLKVLKTWDCLVKS